MFQYQILRRRDILRNTQQCLNVSSIDVGGEKKREAGCYQEGTENWPLNKDS